jgi:hypothetical protein
MQDGAGMSESEGVPRPVRLQVLASERVLEFAVVHKQPAFLGERYHLTLQLKKLATYEITSILATFCEVQESEKRHSRRDRKQSSRKASVVSSDSWPGEGPDWSYALYVPTPGMALDPESSEPLEGSITKLTHHHCTLPAMQSVEQRQYFYMQFREEGKKTFELILRYTGKKLMHDGTYGPEFTLDCREFFSVEVQCPFSLACEWLTSDPCTSCINAQFALEGQGKTHLAVKKQAFLGVRINTGSYQSVRVHDVRLKLKDSGPLRLVDNYTLPSSQWEPQPVVVGYGESFSACFALQPAMQFDAQQFADLEVVWSRANDRKEDKTVCSMPVWDVTSTESCVDVRLDPPPRAQRFKEFRMAVRLRNTTATGIETKVVLEENPHFCVAGELSTHLTLPPHGVDTLNYAMVPLRSGKFELPKITLYMVAGGKECEPILSTHFDQSVFVFPS